MSKKLGIVLAIVCIVAIGLSVAALAVAVPALSKSQEAKEAAVPALKQSEALAHAVQAMPQDVQYVLYLGTNDKDSNLPVFDHEEAKAKAIEILLAHFGGYTLQEANGGWVDGEIVYEEYSLVIYLSDTTLEQVHLACDDLIEAFHQSSILIQSNLTVTEFYSGE